MANTDNRRVIENYWYTSAQIIAVGKAWAQGSPERVFRCSDREIPNRTDLDAENMPLLNELPKKILLPLNKANNHWTAIAINMDIGADEKVNVSISYTDSLNTETNFQAHGVAIRLEIARIENLFRELYGSSILNMKSSVYPHTWRQPDTSSCGPYALANAARCLDGKGREANLGRKTIREHQLNMMTQNIDFSACSTNNAIDEILLDWIGLDY
jgi:hypothetical protein